MHSSERKNNFISAGLIWSGTFLILVSLVILVLSFAPLLSLELQYRNLITPAAEQTDNVAINEFSKLLQETDNTDLTDFMLFIPAIDAKSLVVADVDATNQAIYSEALNYGIAHALGTALPGNNGNTFLFAHSGRNFYESTQQNVQFYLLDKLIIQDLVYLKYYNKMFKYEVSSTVKVWPNDTAYLTNQDYDYNKLTLMSCWPAGVNYQRQIVEATLIETFELPTIEE